MKNYLSIIFCSILLIGINSCKKEEPTPVSAPPVFYFTGTVDGDPISLHAGVDNYYMYSYFNQDANNVFNFVGYLNVYNCTSCGKMLQVKIDDFQASPLNGNAAIETSLAPGNYSFSKPGGTPTGYYVTFNTVATNGTPSHIYLNFGDGTYVDTQYMVNSHVYAHPGTYRVTQRATFASVIDSTSYNIRFGIPEAELTGTISATVSGTTIYCNNFMYGVPPYSFDWDFGDGNHSTQEIPSHTYVNPTPAVYTVSVRVRDAIGGVLEASKNIATQGYIGSYSGFYINQPIPLSNPNGFSNVTITWKDDSGTTYTSNNSAQPSSSYFKLISAEDYLNNTNGERTKKIHVKFKCKVFSATDSLDIENGDAVIAVAYQ